MIPSASATCWMLPGARDLEIIAAIVEHDLPELIPALEAVLHELLERNP